MVSILGLTKRAIGDYVTRDAKFCQDVLREFIILQKFKGAEVLPALRLFLNSFEMSGEGQIVDRVMMLFAQCYCELNQPSVFKDDGAFASDRYDLSTRSSLGDCHIFLYAVMLLQTSLHNPNVKNSMKCNEFVKLCECCNLPREFLVVCLLLCFSQDVDRREYCRKPSTTLKSVRFNTIKLPLQREAAC